MTSTPFEIIEHEAGLCIVGAGMAGIGAALAAARRGTKVVLMHDRPVLGGNASSECRVHICGADRSGKIPNMRETGILEELKLENVYRNPNESYGIWDTILYEKVFFEPNIELLLNCSCLAAEMDGNRIVSITGWQLTTQQNHKIKADIFADCSGDGILAPLTGAEVRMGREARGEFNESIAPEKADNRTMGMTCLFKSREYDTPQPYSPPAWARRFDKCSDLPGGHRWLEMGYWWVELGGEHHSIHDTEKLRHELFRIAYGVWDHLKNHCGHKDEAKNWALDWMQFLPAKRESRRFVGDHILTQNDVEAEGRFEDVVAYGGWTMDDHHPAGFEAVKIGAPPTVFNEAPSPYGIPYRCLYSKNIDNLMFAGRNISATHSAMSSTRVMGTCCVMGQALGTAAALAIDKKTDPRGVSAHMKELQQSLLADDCYLPWVEREPSDLMREASLEATHGNPEPVRDGTSRPVKDVTHAWEGSPGDELTYRFEKPRPVKQISLVLDSELERLLKLSHLMKHNGLRSVPQRMLKSFRIEGKNGSDWETIAQIDGNYQRLVRVPIQKEVKAIRLGIEGMWGAETTQVFSFAME